jgi:aspartyl-tRNA(Asn)/glutamyl-tRNA(Gln) amidotransferase subunit C
MQVSKEQLLHIANLARLNLKEDEIDNYLENLQDILSFAENINNAQTEGLGETIGATDKCNAFRKDEVVKFEDEDALLQNAPSLERRMFNIPKVIQ